MKRTIDDIRGNLSFVGCDNETALEMCEEIERLTAIVERLPRTADGVPIMPDSDTVFAINQFGEIFTTIIVRNPVGWIVRGNRHINASKTYSTREAAEKARQANDR